MRRRRRSSLPLMMVELAVASAETIARRTYLMATGRCSPMEYGRMMAEKLTAAGQTGRRALSRRAGPASLLAPWHRAARRNATRLRRR
ncbi:MAG TPA: hypothetical protein VGB82_22895 [Alphaproteobacteria bacterium]